MINSKVVQYTAAYFIYTKDEFHSYPHGVGLEFFICWYLSRKESQHWEEPTHNIHLYIWPHHNGHNTSSFGQMQGLCFRVTVNDNQLQSAQRVSFETTKT